MKAKNVTEVEMKKALELVNQKYDGNVVFKRFEPIGKRFNFTLRVKNSSGKGAKTGFTGRKTINACWHVHGHFFEALLSVNQNAVIKSGNTITIDKNGGNWQDRNIGSMIEPLYYSEACKCD